MKTIIVPTDFSPIAENAANYAVDMAVAIHANVHLLHVISLPLTISEVPIPSDYFDSTTKEAKADIEELKLKLLQRVKNGVNISVSVTMGDVLDEIDEVAKQKGVFAVIMGIQGAGAGERLAFGSNAFAAIHKLRCPVMIIPRNASYHKVFKIALACDIHDEGAIPAKSITGIVNFFNSSLDIVYVNKKDRKDTPAKAPDARNLQETLTACHPKIHTAINANIGRGIIEFIEKEKTDMLMLIPKKHSFPASLFHVSVSNEVATHLHIPILYLHEE